MSFTCSQCNKSFSSKQNLEKHLDSVHLKLKPFNCNQCDKSFPSKQNLDRHTDTVHLKIKAFECTKCNESFSLKHHLKSHVHAIHTNPRPKSMSRGEQTVYDVLENLELEHGTDFKTEYKFKDLLGIGNRQLRYDFAIFHEETLLLIEFDGRQHFKQVKWQNNESDEATKQRYQMTRCHDKRKNKFARKNEYPLLRIKYSDVNKCQELIEEFLKDYSDILDY